MVQADLETLREIKRKIDLIEEAARQMKTLGAGVPAVEKNAQCVLSAVYVLKFGISDILDIQD
ncbi:MAG: hypothetical protein HY912_01985 [Desulfomonile tiedjei]|uniref:Uncharacterized protein n=1 Tax=Desulfomonile tiedjei TaxID=2358 RepID=A0A9D6UXH7_9BACT|nr:hypothetical protein [Desulfomonile tiedjei]